MNIDIIRIKVDDRTFYTSKNTLKNSTYFSTFLDRWCNGENKLYLDVNPDSFEELLNLLRYGYFSDKLRRDSSLYKMILKDADYYNISIPDEEDVEKCIHLQKCYDCNNHYFNIYKCVMCGNTVKNCRPLYSSYGLKNYYKGYCEKCKSPMFIKGCKKFLQNDCGCMV